VKWQQLEQEHTNEPNETPLKNKNPASPDQKDSHQQKRDYHGGLNNEFFNRIGRIPSLDC
jgi:hypothetical protein